MEYENYPKPKKKRRWSWILLAVALAVGLSAALHWSNFPAIHIEKTENGLSLYMGETAREREVFSDVQEPAPAAQDSSISLQMEASAPGAPQKPQADGLSLQEIYDAALPSVVTVTTRTYGGAGLGTGVIMSRDGYIITNRHVIEDAEAISVQLYDGAEFPAAIVGSDAVSDLAVLKVEAQDLQPARFGDSDSLRVGDLAVAIGNPLGVGLRGTMTDGIISGISRDLTVSGRKMTLLQTNAALNSGNSGGPLLNCYGQVVGLCAAKLQGDYFTGNVEGLGFAIPMSTVKPIVDDLIHTGYVTGRGAIGIMAESLPMRARIYFGLPEGAYVTEVDPVSDAYLKGLREGDIITAFNGQPVSDPAALNAMKDLFSAGDTVTLSVFRDGNFLQLEVVLMEQVVDSQ